MFPVRIPTADHWICYFWFWVSLPDTTLPLFLAWERHWELTLQWLDLITAWESKLSNKSTGSCLLTTKGPITTTTTVLCTNAWTTPAKVPHAGNKKDRQQVPATNLDIRLCACTFRSSCLGMIVILLPSTLRIFPWRLISSPSHTSTLSPAWRLCSRSLPVEISQ